MAKKTSLGTLVHSQAARRRLRLVRRYFPNGADHGYSLRGFAQMVRETTGFRQSQKSVERQEKGPSRLDGDWVLAVSLATGVDASWLLFGRGVAPDFLPYRERHPEAVRVNLQQGDAETLFDGAEEDRERRAA